MTIDHTNYFQASVANFTSCPEPDGPPDFVSRGGSRYWHTSEGVIRQSDHWGPGIRQCDWYLDGQAIQPFRWHGLCLGEAVCGFCRWEDFRDCRLAEA